MQTLASSNSRDDVRKAQKSLERAVALDPRYGRAWSGLSIALLRKMNLPLD